MPRYDSYKIMLILMTCTLDINECKGVNDCQQLCTNMEGSYSCSCTQGFDLAEDGRSCTGNYKGGKRHLNYSLQHKHNGCFTNLAKEFCAENGRCSDICAVVDFEERCFCPLGFNLTTPTECTGN